MTEKNDTVLYIYMFMNSKLVGSAVAVKPTQDSEKEKKLFFSLSISVIFAVLHTQNTQGESERETEKASPSFFYHTVVWC